MEDRKAVIEQSEAFVKQEFEERIPTDLGYHNLNHTLETKDYALEIGKGVELGEEDLEVIELACLFHDLGYSQTYQNHEEISAQMAVEFLNQQAYPADRIQQVEGCIMATKVPQEPRNLLEQVVCDADLRTTGLEIFVERSVALRAEWELYLDLKVSERLWWEKAIEFLEAHHFHTEYSREHYEEGKKQNIERLKEMVAQLPEDDPDDAGTNAELFKMESPMLPKKKKKKDKKKKKKKPKVVENSEFSGLSEEEIAQAIKKKIKEKTPDRGVETMFRTSSRNHIQLSAIADNKANIMLSINAIIISIVLSALIPQLNENPQYLYPTMILMTVCVVSIIFATLSTIPKVTQGTFTRKDIENKTANLLFFGNFHSMDLDVFESGMREMMVDRDFLYGAMTRDLYFLGKVLNRKYKYLRYCYNIFMFGIIVTVVAFAASEMIH